MDITAQVVVPIWAIASTYQLFWKEAVIVGVYMSFSNTVIGNENEKMFP